MGYGILKSILMFNKDHARVFRLNGTRVGHRLGTLDRYRITVRLKGILLFGGFLSFSSKKSAYDWLAENFFFPGAVIKIIKLAKHGPTPVSEFPQFIQQRVRSLKNVK